MDRLASSPAAVTFALIAAAPLWLAACGDRADSGNAQGADAANSAMNMAAAPVLMTFDSATGNAAASAADKGEVGARAVLDTWARAVERGDAATVKAQWGESAAPVAALPVGWREAHLTVGKGTMEGAAGSSYYGAPVHIAATDAAGKPVTRDISVTVRRVNDVDGATPAQLRWHLSALEEARDAR